jgi:hypothetical protein
VAKSTIKISSKPEFLKEGLFGQVFLFVFEILPLLYENKIFPNWEISATHYGAPPNGFVIPGILDIAYEETICNLKEVSLEALRNFDPVVLGNDWQLLNKIWTSYFRIPNKILDHASNIVDGQNIVGIHYRGTDKQDAHWDSNPVKHKEFLKIIEDFLGGNNGARKVFVATDDKLFSGFLRENLRLEVINLGRVEYHKSSVTHAQIFERTYRALLDCVILTKCKSVLTTSSALPAFAKVLNPNLEICRATASKLFTDIPYFPIAYIPRYSTRSPEVTNIINRLMLDDWEETRNVDRFKNKFAYQTRYPGSIAQPIRKSARDAFSGDSFLSSGARSWCRRLLGVIRQLYRKLLRHRGGPEQET